MLGKNEFENFIDEINTTYYFFSIWVHLGNKYSKIQHGCKLNKSEKSIIIALLISLQQNFALGISRLLDQPYFLEDKNKPRLSAFYVIEKLGNEEISRKYNEKIKTPQMKKFIYSNRQLRDERFGHNSIGKKPMKQKAGIEEFFNILKWLVEEIILKNIDIEIEKKINFEYFGKLASEGSLELCKKFQ